MKVLDDYNVASVAVSRDGRHVAAGGYYKLVEGEPVGGVRLYTGETAASAVLPFAPPVTKNGLAFAPAGDRIAATSPGNVVRLTDLAGPSRYWDFSVGENAKWWSVRAWDGRTEGNGIDAQATAGVLLEALGKSAGAQRPATSPTRKAAPATKKTSTTAPKRTRVPAPTKKPARRR